MMHTNKQEYINRKGEIMSKDRCIYNEVRHEEEEEEEEDEEEEAEAHKFLCL